MQDDDPFRLLGGEEGVRRLVDRFYDVMDSRPYALALRRMHPEDLASSRDKLAWFLTGWSGGPQRYVERYGHPRLRARHMPFPIDVAARDAWLACMHEALEAEVANEELRILLYASMERIADHMRNIGEATP